MDVTGKPRAGIGAWTVTAAAIFAAVFTLGGASTAQAQTPPRSSTSRPRPPPSRSASRTAPTRWRSPSRRKRPFRPLHPPPVPADVHDLRPHSPAPASVRPCPRRPRACEPARSLMTRRPAFAAPMPALPTRSKANGSCRRTSRTMTKSASPPGTAPPSTARISASGEVFDEMAMTAAHPTLPIPSLVRVTNLENGKIGCRSPQRSRPVRRRPHHRPLEGRRRGARHARQRHGQGPRPVCRPRPGRSQRRRLAQPVPEAAVVRPADARRSRSSRSLPRLPAPPQASDPRLSSCRPARSPISATPRPCATSCAPPARFRSRPAPVNGSDYYRVMVGPWASRAEAERAQGRQTAGSESHRGRHGSRVESLLARGRGGQGAVQIRPRSAQRPVISDFPAVDGRARSAFMWADSRGSPRHALHRWNPACRAVASSAMRRSQPAAPRALRLLQVEPAAAWRAIR